MTNIESVKIVGLDWSGTISDDRRPVYAANMAILRTYGKPTMTFEEWLPRTRLTAAEFLQAHGVEETSKVLLQRYEQELAAAKERGFVPTAYPDALSTLAFLSSRGLRIAILSTHPTDHLLSEAREFGLAPYISTLMGGSEDKAVGLLTLVREFELSEARRMIYVGDSIFDIQAAKAAGVIPAAVCTGYHTRERLAAENPDFIFESLGDLKLTIQTARAGTVI